MEEMQPYLCTSRRWSHSTKFRGKISGWMSYNLDPLFNRLFNERKIENAIAGHMNYRHFNHYMYHKEVHYAVWTYTRFLELGNKKHSLSYKHTRTYTDTLALVHRRQALKLVLFSWVFSSSLQVSQRVVRRWRSDNSFVEPVFKHFRREIVRNRTRTQQCTIKEPYHVKAVNVHHHLSALKFVELFTDGSLLLRREASPWSVGSPIVILSIGYFDVVVKPYDLLQIQKQIQLRRWKKTQITFSMARIQDFSFTFLAFSSSTVGLKLSLRNSVIFFSSRSFFSSAGLVPLSFNILIML